MLPRALPGSLFEVILVPSWHQVGSKGGFLAGRETEANKNMKKKFPGKSRRTERIEIWGCGLLKETTKSRPADQQTC